MRGSMFSGERCCLELKSSVSFLQWLYSISVEIKLSCAFPVSERGLPSKLYGAKPIRRERHNGTSLVGIRYAQTASWKAHPRSKTSPKDKIADISGRCIRKSIKLPFFLHTACVNPYQDLAKQGTQRRSISPEMAGSTTMKIIPQYEIYNSCPSIAYHPQQTVICFFVGDGQLPQK